MPEGSQAAVASLGQGVPAAPAPWTTGLNHCGSPLANGERREKFAHLFGVLQVFAGFLVLWFSPGCRGVAGLLVPQGQPTLYDLLWAPPWLCLHTQDRTQSVCPGMTLSLCSGSKWLWGCLFVLCF